MNELKLSLVQLNLVWENKKANLKKIEKMIGQDSEKGKIILLPEMFSTGFSMNPDGLAEPMNGDTVLWMRELASKMDSLLAGSLIISENGKYFNRFIAMSSEGVVAQYDKRHLFRMAHEESVYTPGSSRVVFNWKGWRILPQICYDIRFPVWIRNQDDYDLSLFVANWPSPRRDVWRNLLVARALENQSFVAGVNRIGMDNKGIYHSGDSKVIDPKGSDVIDCSDHECMSTVSLNLDDVSTFRDKFPAFKDRDNFIIKP